MSVKVCVCVRVVQPWNYFKGKMLNQAQTKTLMLPMRTQNKRYVSWHLFVHVCVCVCVDTKVCVRVSVHVYENPFFCIFV